jgi:hypothetical protein
MMQWAVGRRLLSTSFKGMQAEEAWLGSRLLAVASAGARLLLEGEITDAAGSNEVKAVEHLGAGSIGLHWQAITVITVVE